MIKTSATLVNDAKLAPLTTLNVGGAASCVAMPLTEAETLDVVRATLTGQVPLHIIGGGSNVVIADDGLDGVVMKSSDFLFEVNRDGDDVIIDAGAGVQWDELVAYTVAEGFTGIETLSGIPGLVGAAPIQNIGAYGTELSERVVSVRAIDRYEAAIREFSAEECGFGYRQSHFKGEWRGRFVVTRVRLRLTPGAPSEIRYPELARALGTDQGVVPSLQTVRDVVLKIRRRKSMVYDKSDANHRSCGSFFVNPIVSAETAAGAAAAAAALGHDDMPSWQVDGGTKLSAAWLIERAGFEKGFAFGRAGLSTKHCLALINRGGATARDMIALASIVRKGVRSAFGVTLVPEPNFMGFDDDVETLLA